jgi:hypothetical protein
MDDMNSEGSEGGNGIKPTARKRSRLLPQLLQQKFDRLLNICHRAAEALLSVVFHLLEIIAACLGFIFV